MLKLISYQCMWCKYTSKNASDYCPACQKDDKGNKAKNIAGLTHAAGYSNDDYPLLGKELKRD